MIIQVRQGLSLKFNQMKGDAGLVEVFPRQTCGDKVYLGLHLASHLFSFH